jgi:uncharacterized protein (TIGR02145 family)
MGLNFLTKLKTSCFFLLLLVVIISCKKKNISPSVSTIGISNLTSQTVVVEGKVNNHGNSILSAQGVVISKYPDPVVPSLGYVTAENTANNYFVSTIINLEPQTLYYLRTYVTDNTGKTYYSEESTFSTPPSETSQFNPNKSYGTMADIEGNQYKTVEIGGQTWMAENLKVSKFNDGSLINEVLSPNVFTNGGNPAWCYYNDSVEYNDLHGKLYNYYVTMNVKNVCPTGWHIPNSDDINSLMNYLSNNPGGKLKAIGYNYWNSPNVGATNETGFSAIGTGYRSNDFWGNKSVVEYWCKNGTSANILGINAGMEGGSNQFTSDLYYNFENLTSNKGYSIRCIKD